MFIVVFFATILYFFTVQKGRRGGGGGVQLFIIIIYFFFFWGGGGGVGVVQILISIETYITCDFSGGGGGGGGGGGSGPPIPLWIRAWVRISNCPLPCHGLSFLKVLEGLPAGAVGNMCFFFRRWGGGGGANAYFQRNLKNL